MTDKTCLSYWFPILAAGGVPVPRTEIVRVDFASELWGIVDGEKPACAPVLWQMIHDAATRIGDYPVFLRTGHTSNKHNWTRTCFLDAKASIPSRVYNLVEFSCLADMCGLPIDVWVVREMLPVQPVAVCPFYRNMPVVREVRAFIGDGKIHGWHPYWPGDALQQGMRETLSPSVVEHVHNIDYPAVRPIIASVAELFKDDIPMSVDVLETDRGWFVTDMADAARSFRWDEGMRPDQ